MISLGDLLQRETEFGCTVGQLRVMSDHYLVEKIRIEDHSDGVHGVPVLLPDTHVRKSVGNLVAIKARVVRASEPFRSRHTKRRVVGLDADTGQYVYKYIQEPGEVTQPRVTVGEGIIYNSYSVGKVGVDGLSEPLVFVRGIDIEAAFPIEDAEGIQVGEWALEHGEAVK